MPAKNEDLHGNARLQANTLLLTRVAADIIRDTAIRKKD
jgi:hypothetical protein